MQNFEEILGDWEKHKPSSEGTPRQVRKGWCFIQQQDAVEILDPDFFATIKVWGPVEIQQGRLLRNEQYTYTPVVITDHSSAWVEPVIHMMGCTNEL